MGPTLHCARHVVPISSFGSCNDSIRWNPLPPFIQTKGAKNSKLFTKEVKSLLKVTENGNLELVLYLLKDPMTSETHLHCLVPGQVCGGEKAPRAYDTVEKSKDRSGLLGVLCGFTPGS